MLYLDIVKNLIYKQHKSKFCYPIHYLFRINDFLKTCSVKLYCSTCRCFNYLLLMYVYIINALIMHKMFCRRTGVFWNKVMFLNIISSVWYWNIDSVDESLYYESPILWSAIFLHFFLFFYYFLWSPTNTQKRKTNLGSLASFFNYDFDNYVI